MERIAEQQAASRRTKAQVAAAVILWLLAGCGGESNPEAERAAVAATEPILEQIDAGQYDAVRDAASPLLKQQVSPEEWLAEVRALRGPLGSHKSRTVGSTTYVTDPWGAPEGEYVIVSYDSHWQNGRIHENLSMQRQPNGAWALAGYHAQEQ